VGRDFQGDVEDTCNPNAKLVVASAESNQPDNDKGDGDTVNDVVVFPDRVCLRAERQGNDRDGRLYTIYLGSRDASGNDSDPQMVQVVVPHDQRPGSRCPTSEDLEIVEDSNPICDPGAATAQDGKNGSEQEDVENDSLEPDNEGGCSTGNNRRTGLLMLMIASMVVVIRNLRRK